jgi:hypothetical protein
MLGLLLHGLALLATVEEQQMPETPNGLVGWYS